MAPTPFSLVCLRAHPRGIDDETQLNILNERIMNRINVAGHFFLSHTKIHNHFTIRVAIGNLRTTEQHVRELWKEMQTYVTDDTKSC
jgi:aromatic-L-amino-acid decarboxylase